MQVLPELPEQVGVGQRPVPRRRHERVALDECIEAVTAFRRIDRAGKLHGAQHVRREAKTHAPEFAFEEAVVEVRVMRDEEPAVQPFKQTGCELFESRGVAHHRVGDAGQLLDERGNRLLRVDER